MVLRRGIGARHVHLRLQHRGALGCRLAEVAGALRRVGLDDRAGRAHASEPCRVVGARLDAVERILDCAPRGAQVAHAPLQLGAEGAEHAGELRFVDVRPDASGLVEQGARRDVLAAPQRELGPAQVEVHEEAAHRSCADLVHQPVSHVPVPGLDRQLGP